MTLTMHDTHDSHVRALDARQAQLELRIERCSAAIRAANGDDPSLGRELDAATSLLAQVRAELALRLGDATAAAR
jgi:outer membrane murein-binding lipoprotein Lpp